MPVKRQYSEVEKERILSEIKALRKAGTRQIDAVKKAGISSATYFTWNKGSKRRPKATPTLLHLTAPETAERPQMGDYPVILISCRAGQLKTVLEQLR